MKLARFSVFLAAVAVVAAVALASGLSAFAQAQAPSGGSLAEVAAEIRLLRAALEENGKNQTLASMLTAQQGRLQPYVSQLAAVRKQIDDTASQTRSMNANYLATQAETAPPGVVARGREDRLKQMQGALQALMNEESDLRNREAEITQAIQREEAAWNDLMNRLQTAIKR